MKKLILILLLSGLVMSSCEVPVHEEYHLYNNQNDNGDNQESYLPLATGNTWTYEIWDYTQDPPEMISENEENSILGTVNIDGKDYYTFTPKISDQNGIQITTNYRIRKEGDDYFSNFLIEFSNSGYEAEPFEFLMLKDNVAPGDSWTEEYTQHFIYSGVPTDIGVQSEFTVEAVHDTFDVNEATYEHVLELHEHRTKTDGSVLDIVYYYALNIGKIKMITSINGQESNVQILTSYQLQ